MQIKSKILKNIVIGRLRNPCLMVHLMKIELTLDIGDWYLRSVGIDNKSISYLVATIETPNQIYHKSLAKRGTGTLLIKLEPEVPPTCTRGTSFRVRRWWDDYCDQTQQTLYRNLVTKTLICQGFLSLETIYCWYNYTRYDIHKPVGCTNLSKLLFLRYI